MYFVSGNSVSGAGTCNLCQAFESGEQIHVFWFIHLGMECRYMFVSGPCLEFRYMYFVRHLGLVCRYMFFRSCVFVKGCKCMHFVRGICVKSAGICVFF